MVTVLEHPIAFDPLTEDIEGSDFHRGKCMIFMRT